jgi:hypothetical protein
VQLYFEKYFDRNVVLHHYDTWSLFVLEFYHHLTGHSAADKIHSKSSHFYSIAIGSFLI